MRSWLPLGLTILLVQGFVLRLLEAKKEDEWQGWTCDDMTYDLCDDLQVSKGSFTSRNSLEIHYWRYSPPVPIDSLPIIVVNGGPGTSHNYDLPTRQLACRRGREVIFYDQGGTGLSATPENTTVAADFPFLLDISYYGEEELPKLIEALKLDKFHLVADSWGTMIAMQYAIYHERPNLVSISFHGPIPKATDYSDLAWDPDFGSIATLPSYVKGRVHALEASGDLESEEMQQISQLVMTGFLLRNGIPPDCAVASLLHTNEEVVVGLWAVVDWLTMTGTLKNFDMYPLLAEKLSDIPALLTCGEFDIVRPVTIEAMHADMPLSETIVFKGSGHASLFDANEEQLNAVDDFLVRVESSLHANEPFEAKASKTLTSAAVDGTPISSINIAISTALVVVAFLVGLWVGKRAQKPAEYSEIV